MGKKLPRRPARNPLLVWLDMMWAAKRARLVAAGTTDPTSGEIAALMWTDIRQKADRRGGMAKAAIDYFGLEGCVTLAKRHRGLMLNAAVTTVPGRDTHEMPQVYAVPKRDAQGKRERWRTLRMFVTASRDELRYLLQQEVATHDASGANIEIFGRCLRILEDFPQSSNVEEALPLAGLTLDQFLAGDSWQKP